MGLMLSINSTHLNPALTILRWHCYRHCSCSPVHLSTVQCVSRTTSLIHCQLKFHTHLLLLLHPFNGLFSGTTWVSWYQKDKISLDLMRQEILFLGMAVASAGLYANNLRLAPDRQPHQSLILQAGCSSWRPASSVSISTNMKAVAQLIRLCCSPGAAPGELL